MDRFRELNLFQKLLLVLLATMILVFGIIYAVVSSRVGILYMDQILEPSEENGNTVYSGIINNQESRFVVTPEKVVTFQYGEKEYGPYTAKEDPTAVPKDSEFSKYMTGVVVRDGGEILFRGGIFQTGGERGIWILTNEDGSDASISITATTSGGINIDSEGNIVDPMEPSVVTVLKLMEGPELTREGNWGFWYLGMFVSIMTAASIIFADELFRWRMWFQIRDADFAEPSDWTIMVRNVSWSLLAVLALLLYVKGLS